MATILSRPQCAKYHQGFCLNKTANHGKYIWDFFLDFMWLSGVPDYFGRNKISSGGDLSHYSSASLY